MFVQNINPVLVHFGAVQIRYYGIIYALGFIITYFFLKHAITRKKLRLTQDDLDQFMLYLIIGVVIMARFFDVFIYSYPFYHNHIIEFFKIWTGGLSFHGGLVGAILAVVLFTQKKKIHFYELADAISIPAVLALALGRIANFINSELYGTIANPLTTPWCVVFEKVDGFCRHPVQIYQSIKDFTIFGILFFMNRKKQKQGTIFWTFILLYGILRFSITFWRIATLFWT